MLCVVVVVVTSPFSYLTGGRNARSGQPKMADSSALITKDASLDAPNVRGCPKLSLSLEPGDVLTFGLKRDIGAL